MEEKRNKIRGVDTQQVTLTMDMDVYNKVAARAKAQGVTVQSWINYNVGDKLRALDIAEEASRRVTEEQVKKLYSDSFNLVQQSLNELSDTLSADPISAREFLQGLTQMSKQLEIEQAQEQEQQNTHTQNAE